MPPPEVVQPVQITGGAPKAGEQVVLEGRFVFRKRPVSVVWAQLERTGARGRPVTYNTSSGKAIDEGDGHYAYRIFLRCPPKPGEYNLHIRVGRDYVVTRKVFVRPAKRPP